jgi:hypothetical protein
LLSSDAGDLKPENILRFGYDARALPTLKLADFGVAKLSTAGTAVGTVAGTLVYMAPELKVPGHQARQNSKVDIFSLGKVGTKRVATHKLLDQQQGIMPIDHLAGVRRDAEPEGARTGLEQGHHLGALCPERVADCAGLYGSGAPEAPHGCPAAGEAERLNKRG